MNTIPLLSNTNETILHYADYILPIFMLMMFVILIFLFLSVRYKLADKKNKKILAEKEEKIHFLRQINAENESRKISKEHEAEKEILSLNHSIKNLEQQAKEGTKNQVVAKIEAQQAKRAKLKKRAGLAD